MRCLKNLVKTLCFCVKISKAGSLQRVVELGHDGRDNPSRYVTHANAAVAQNAEKLTTVLVGSLFIVCGDAETHLKLVPAVHREFDIGITHVKTNDHN